MKLKETADFQKVRNAQKNRKSKERRKERKREWKENNPKPQNAMDVVKAVSEKRKNGATAAYYRATMYK